MAWQTPPFTLWEERFWLPASHMLCLRGLGSPRGLSWAACNLSLIRPRGGAWSAGHPTLTLQSSPPWLTRLSSNLLSPTRIMSFTASCPLLFLTLTTFDLDPITLPSPYPQPPGLEISSTACSTKICSNALSSLAPPFSALPGPGFCSSGLICFFALLFVSNEPMLFQIYSLLFFVSI